jgi:hypothetical protein
LYFVIYENGESGLCQALRCVEGGPRAVDSWGELS